MKIKREKLFPFLAAAAAAAALNAFFHTSATQSCPLIVARLQLLSFSAPFTCFTCCQLSAKRGGAAAARSAYMTAISHLICRLAVPVEIVLFSQFFPFIPFCFWCFTFCMVILLPLEPRHDAASELFQLPSILCPGQGNVLCSSRCTAKPNCESHVVNAVHSIWLLLMLMLQLPAAVVVGVVVVVVACHCPQTPQSFDSSVL